MLAEEASESTDQLPGRTKAWSRQWRWQTIASKISLPNGTVRKPKLTLLWFSIFAKMSNFVPHACSFANEGCRAQVRCWPQRSPSLLHALCVPRALRRPMRLRHAQQLPPAHRCLGNGGFCSVLLFTPQDMRTCGYISTHLT